MLNKVEEMSVNIKIPSSVTCLIEKMIKTIFSELAIQRVNLNP